MPKLLFLIISCLTIISNAHAASQVPTSPYFTIQGERPVFNRPAYGTTGNLVVNSNFSSGTAGWEMTNLTDNKGNPLYSTAKHDGKAWLRVNQEYLTGNGKQGLLEQTIAIPLQLRNEIIEVSFLVSGLFTGFQISNDGSPLLFYAKIDPANPERIYYYYHPNGASSFTISFMKGYPGQIALGEYYDITEVAVRPATRTYQSISQGLPASGGSLQFARWIMGTWDEKVQLKQLANNRKMGGMCRVWLSAELLGTYITKNNPAKRTSSHLTSQYVNAQTAKVFTGIDPVKIKKLDWFFDAARQQGLKLSVGIVGSFTDGAGNPHPTLSLPGSFEFLDTDTDVRNGFITLIKSIVSRYKGYENIVCWDALPESWILWKNAFSGYSASAPLATERSLTFAGYRVFERSAYAAIKAIDPVRPVLRHVPGYAGVYFDANYLLNTDSVCDWSGITSYLGAIHVGLISGTPATFWVGSGKTNSLANGTPLKVYTSGTLPIGMNGSTTYYVVNVTSTNFQVATAPGGVGIKTNAGFGNLFFYSTDGTSLAAFDNVFQRWSDFPKTTILAEMGAPADVGLLYRNDNYEAPYLREGFRRLQKYGFASGIVFDEGNILWDSNFNLNESGKVTESVGPTMLKQ